MTHIEQEYDPEQFGDLTAKEFYYLQFVMRYDLKYHFEKHTPEVKKLIANRLRNDIQGYKNRNKKSNLTEWELELLDGRPEINTEPKSQKDLIREYAEKAASIYEERTAGEFTWEGLLGSFLNEVLGL